MSTVDFDFFVTYLKKSLVGSDSEFESLIASINTSDPDLARVLSQLRLLSGSNCLPLLEISTKIKKAETSISSLVQALTPTPESMVKNIDLGAIHTHHR